jgi:glutathione synthase/RimK-type ligase-like ATP-grasp enzyme
MPVVAFATYRESPAITEDDALAAGVLRKRGIEVIPIVWDDPSADWNRFDLVIVRSSWDYHQKRISYERWLQSLPSGLLWNPPEAILANLNKRYLLELERRGINVVPTAYVQASETSNLKTIIEKRGWNEVVVKPAVSLGARSTWRSSFAAGAGDEQKFSEQVKSEDTLVQEYFPEIASAGEWSFIFFNGQFSHAVLKKPCDGDFRVQNHFGGHAERARPCTELIAQASATLLEIGSSLLYARVDGIERDGLLFVMELEINEPHLFLSLSENADILFANAIMRLLQRS